ncbi:hypothetical protein JTE90_018828 [Oedothorax gibbosus]|uniref:Uncharacterized protein n=1 Tax=Oedothorax gibbosus TaxID=931172 RepID=A0AAV6UWR0_9ARAC|nr:hypothetical protein JTE90_018828 [Oedothorax gibbosus]
MALSASGKHHLLYALVAVLYIGLCLDFYLTAKLYSGRSDEDVIQRRSKRSYYGEDEGPSVEFFPQPQPTHETEGYMWLTSYSRIPDTGELFAWVVSTVLV